MVDWGLKKKSIVLKTLDYGDGDDDDDSDYVQVIPKYGSRGTKTGCGVEMDRGKDQRLAG